ncbi:MAG TPA: S8 family serine peptidase, partial [Fimbriimonadaceae bacterium]|nr:S8 family serine peptidase [Fimbriimonadaceae bacterium]
MRRLAFLLLLTILCSSAFAGVVEIPYWKSNRVAEVDHSRLAVWVDPAASKGGEAVVSGEFLQVDRHPVAGWRIGSLPLAIRSELGAKRLLDELAEQRGIGFVSPVLFDDFGGTMLVTPDIFVRFGAGIAKERAIRRLSQYGTLVEEGFAGLPNVYRIRSFSRNGLEVLEAAREISAWADVVFAEPDLIFTGRGSYLPNDPSFPLSWGLNNTGQFSGSVSNYDMNAPEAWEATLGASTIKVVVLDTGVQQNHPDLNQVAGMDFTSDGGDGGPKNTNDKHGTPVAGCVTATADNNVGTLGIAPSCLSASARAFIGIENGQWTSQASWTVAALDWASSIGARVTNNSNGYGFTSALIDSKYAQTRDAGIIHFASAGNEGGTTISYPARLSTVVAISAMANNGNLAAFSNRGPEIFLTAPGQQIYATDRTGTAGYNTANGSAGDYAYVSGTSFAAPYAAGVAALVLSVNPTLSAVATENLLRTT